MFLDFIPCCRKLPHLTLLDLSPEFQSLQRSFGVHVISWGYSVPTKSQIVQYDLLGITVFSIFTVHFFWHPRAVLLSFQWVRLLTGTLLSDLDFQEIFNIPWWGYGRIPSSSPCYGFQVCSHHLQTASQPRPHHMARPPKHGMPVPCQWNKPWSEDSNWQIWLAMLVWLKKKARLPWWWIQSLKKLPKKMKWLNASATGKRNCGYRAKGNHFGWMFNMFNWGCRCLFSKLWSNSWQWWRIMQSVEQKYDRRYRKEALISSKLEPWHRSRSACQVWRCLWPIG